MFKNNFITFSKKGVTLVSLVITIIILAIIAGVIVNTTLGDEGVVTEAEKTLREQERKMLIETIAKEIQTTKLKKEMSGEKSFTVQEDIRPILVEYGKYEDLKLKLTTKEGIEIYLYEIMQISMLEYAQIQYNDNKLTITSELLNNGYEIEYTLNNGSAWDEYEEVVNITNSEGIYARIVTKDGKVISNTIKVKEGTMQSDDIVAPIVKIEPSSGKGRTMYVTIDIIEYGQLDESNLYQYYLSTSQFVQENGEWTNYIPGETFTLKPENEGIYYLHIRGVSDKVGNITIDKVVGPYELIKNEGTAAVAPTVTLSVNENTTLSKEQTTVIQIESNNEVMYNYGWSNSSTQAPEQWKASMSKAQTVTIDKGQGNYYLWIKDLQDINGNKADTIIVNGTEVNLISGVFAVDNNKLVSIAVEMRKSTFVTGQKITKSDIIVTATYESGKTQQVTGYTYSPTTSLTTSNKNVTISYTENGVTKTASTQITVTVVATLPEWISTSTSLNATTPYVQETISGATYYAPVPLGFTVVTGTISTGLVIQDSSANQFVWVPVDNSYNITSALNTTITGKTALEYWQDNANGTGTEGSGYNEPYPRTAGSWTKNEWDSMYASVLKYGGFYVGRYETGGSASAPVVKSGVTPVTSIKWNSTKTMTAEPTSGTATYVARNMYPSTSTMYGVVSTLIYGIQWDSVMNWANCASKTRGSSTYAAKPSLTGAVYADGTTYDVNKNIYDLAGNVYEWSMEANGTAGRVLRGGYYDVTYAVSWHFGTSPTGSYSNIGFRTTLYVK